MEGILHRLEDALQVLRLLGSAVLAVCLSPVSWTSKTPYWVFGGCVWTSRGPLTPSEKGSERGNVLGL